MAEIEKSRRSRKRDNTHKSIMHSAKVLFEANGIANVTIDQISEGADVSRSTFFSHFASLDDLLKQIADEEINDIFEAVDTSGEEPSIRTLMRQLNNDTYPYPYLVCELIMRALLSKDETSLKRVDAFMREELTNKGGYEKIRKNFSPKELSAVIFGAYFGMVFQKLINNEPFESPTETNDTIQKFITFLEDREEKL